MKEDELVVLPSLIHEFEQTQEMVKDRNWHCSPWGLHKRDGHD